MEKSNKYGVMKNSKLNQPLGGNNVETDEDLWGGLTKRYNMECRRNAKQAQRLLQKIGKP